MPSNEDEYRPESYHIPPNFTDAGGVFGGRIGKRNAVELLFLCGPLLLLEIKILPLLPFSTQTKIIIGLFTLAPLAFLCAFGIGGESLSQHASAFIQFRRKRRTLHYREFSIDKKKLVGAETKMDRFFENASSYGFVKALSMTLDSSQRVALDTEDPTEKRKKDKADKAKNPQKEKKKKDNTKQHSNYNQTDIDTYDLGEDIATLNDRQEDSLALVHSDKQNRRDTGSETKQRKQTGQRKSFTAGILSAAYREKLLQAFELDDESDY